MNHPNPILEDYQLFVVFRNIGLKMLQQIQAVMSAPPYNTLFKTTAVTTQNELPFTYLEHRFKTQIEVFFNHSLMPKSAFLATYYLDTDTKKNPEEIISYTFELDYTVHDIYTLEDFAEHYLIEFHQNIKKTFSDNHLAFAIKLNGR